MRYGFQVPLRVELQPDGKWRLLQEVRYLSALTQKSYTVPEGFVFDFASVPRLPVAYYLTGNTAHLAALVHDYLYQFPEVEPKEIADKIFAEIMDADFYEGGFYNKGLKEPLWRRILMYNAVSLFGPRHYWSQENSRTAGFSVGAINSVEEEVAIAIEQQKYAVAENPNSVTPPPTTIVETTVQNPVHLPAKEI